MEPTPTAEASARLGLVWGPAHELGLAALTATLRHALPFLPELVRVLPHARRAARLLKCWRYIVDDSVSARVRA